MRPGSGFVELVTLQTIEGYRALLRESTARAWRGGHGGHAYPVLPGHFNGDPLLLHNAFRTHRTHKTKRIARQNAASRRRRGRQRLVNHTEASYHYPQGTHLGHILAYLKILGDGADRAGGPLDDLYIRLHGGFEENRISSYRRQVKYKLLACMELGLIADYRLVPAGESYTLALTESGSALYEALSPLFEELNLVQAVGVDGIPSSQMQSARIYNEAIRNFIEADPDAKENVNDIFLGMPAVVQMRRYLKWQPRGPISKHTIYAEFFHQPYVIAFCESVGVPPATVTAAEHRCPFLLNALDACGKINQAPSHVTLVN